jgi:hypothetical protein
MKDLNNNSQQTPIEQSGVLNNKDFTYISKPSPQIGSILSCFSNLKLKTKKRTKKIQFFNKTQTCTYLGVDGFQKSILKKNGELNDIIVKYSDIKCVHERVVDNFDNSTGKAKYLYTDFFFLIKTKNETISLSGIYDINESNKSNHKYTFYQTVLTNYLDYKLRVLEPAINKNEMITFCNRVSKWDIHVGKQSFYIVDSKNEVKWNYDYIAAVEFLTGFITFFNLDFINDKMFKQILGKNTIKLEYAFIEDGPLLAYLFNKYHHNKIIKN